MKGKSSRELNSYDYVEIIGSKKKGHIVYVSEPKDEKDYPLYPIYLVEIDDEEKTVDVDEDVVWAEKDEIRLIEKWDDE